MDTFEKYLLRRRTQQHGLGGASHARRVELRPKNDNAPVNGAERLQSLVALLAIIQAWAETRHRDISASDECRSAPFFAGGMVTSLYVAVEREMLFGREAGPIYIESVLPL